MLTEEEKRVVVLTNKIGGELIPRSPEESDKILIDVYVKSGYSQEEAERMVTEARKELNKEKNKN